MAVGSGSFRHVLVLSGGKDSAALALYLRKRVHDIEYVFLDSGKELPETHEYVDRLERLLARSVQRLPVPDQDFDRWFAVYGNRLPTPQARWCARHLKIEPFDRFVGDSPVRNYLPLRADEDRGGYISAKRNVVPIYPFREAGITRSDVANMLEEADIGLPPYHRWRLRSGCYFCFFQQKIEWVGLLEHHPNLFEAARAYEITTHDGTRCTWIPNESLEELGHPRRVAQVRAEHERRTAIEQRRMSGGSASDAAIDAIEAYRTDRPCLVCD